MDLIPNKTYEARKIHDELGAGYAIFDEGEDWYRYGAGFVEANFEEIAAPAENLNRAV